MQKMGIIVILICALTGCATMEGGLSNYEPVAIVSVTSNRVINWEGEEESVNGAADQLVRDIFVPNQTKNKVTYSTADNLIEEAANIMFDTLSFSEIAAIVAPADVLETPAYFKAEINTRRNPEDYAKPMAYKFIHNADEDLAINLALEEGIKSTMYLDFTFVKRYANSILQSGSMIAKTIMKVTILYETGKKIYSKTNEYWSQNRIEVVTAAYDDDELMNLFRETLYDAASDLVYTMNQK
jgi:hypothetical protein